MLRNLKFLIMVGMLSIFLAACGTSTGQDNAAEAPIDSEQTNEDVKNEAQGEEVLPEIEEPASQENNTETENDQEGQASQEEQTQTPSNSTASGATEISMNYSLNGEEKVETAYWTKSDNQNFGLNVLSAYELSAEEPNKDLLYFKENDANMMRIEILPGDSDQTALQENTLAQLKVVNENVETLQAPDDEFFSQATVMQATNNGEIVTAYLINKQDSIVKLTIFTSEAQNHQDAFVQMAKTIQIQ